MFPGVLVSSMVPSSIETIYSFKCSACRSVVKQSYMGTARILPNHPGQGWRELEPGTWICPHHTVKILVDGKEWER